MVLLLSSFPLISGPLLCLSDVEGGPLRKNQCLEVFDNHPNKRRFLPAFIIDEKEDEVLVHFKVSGRTTGSYGLVLPSARVQDYHKKFDEWISRDSDRFAPYGRHTQKRLPYRPRKTDYWSDKNRTRNAVLQGTAWVRCKFPSSISLYTVLPCRTIVVHLATGPLPTRTGGERAEGS